MTFNARITKICRERFAFSPSTFTFGFVSEINDFVLDPSMFGFQLIVYLKYSVAFLGLLSLYPPRTHICPSPFRTDVDRYLGSLIFRIGSHLKIIDII
jgi:hypothetical protein